MTFGFRNDFLLDSDFLPVKFWTMEFPLLLQYLGKLLGQETLELNSQGVLGLRFGKDLDINLEPDPDGLRCHMHATLCAVPSDPAQRLKMLEALMSANAFGRGTSNAAFSIDEHANDILLGQIFECSRIEPQDLYDSLLAMVGTLDTWRGRLHGLSDGNAIYDEENYKAFGQS